MIGVQSRSCFFTEVDYPRYLGDLRAAAQRYGVAVHGYRPHPSYLALGLSPEERRSRYRELFDDGVDAERRAEIRAYLQQQLTLRVVLCTICASLVPPSRE